MKGYEIMPVIRIVDDPIILFLANFHILYSPESTRKPPLVGGGGGGGCKMGKLTRNVFRTYQIERIARNALPPLANI